MQNLGNSSPKYKFSNSDFYQDIELIENLNYSKNTHKGKKPKKEIIIEERTSNLFLKGFHSKSRTKTWLRCYLCYKNKINTRSKDYCEICEKTLCNVKRCWDIHHFSIEKQQESDDSDKETSYTQDEF